MISSFEVGATFRIINAASPELTRILKQVRELNASIEKARASLAEIGKPAAMGTAIAETGNLARAWGDVAKNAEAAKLAIGNASMASARAALPTAAAAATGGGGAGGGRHRPGFLARGGAGHHGMIAAGAGLAWGIDQAAKTDDFAWRIEDISGLPHNDAAVHAKVRKIIQDAQVRTGFSLDDVGKAALSVVRLMQGTPGGGLDALPEILTSSATEARRKNTGLAESTSSMVELAHQFRAYSPQEQQALFSTFAALSTADPRSLSAMTRASGYAVPTLSELGVDPSTVLLAGTGLAQAGISSTKSGTWIREAVTRAMPGIVLGHKASNAKHEEALRAMHLIDANGKPTWFTNGKPDELKMFEIAGDALQNMPPELRAVYGRAAFGAQGAGAVAVLGDPVVNARMHAIDELRKSKAYTDRYQSFGADYQAGSTVQDARTAISEFNVTMGELARITLPGANLMLHDFKSALDGLRSVLPSGDGKSLATVVGRAGEGAIAGGVAGAFMGGVGAVPGALIGGITGGAYGVAETYLNGMKASDHVEKAADAIGTAAAKAFDSHMRNLGGPGGGGFKPLQILPPLHINLNVDGRTLASAVSENQSQSSTYQTDTPASNGAESYGP